MDRFEQLTAYFVAASDFHAYRHLPLPRIVALTHELPGLLDKITQPTLYRKLQHLIISNTALISTASTASKGS